MCSYSSTCPFKTTYQFYFSCLIHVFCCYCFILCVCVCVCCFFLFVCLFVCLFVFSKQITTYIYVATLDFGWICYMDSWWVTHIRFKKTNNPNSIVIAYINCKTTFCSMYYVLFYVCMCIYYVKTQL